MGGVDPVRDREVINLELALADLAVVEKRLERVRKTARGGDKDAQAELALLERVQAALSEGKAARAVETDDRRRQLLRSLQPAHREAGALPGQRRRGRSPRGRERPHVARAARGGRRERRAGGGDPHLQQDRVGAGRAAGGGARRVPRVRSASRSRGSHRLIRAGYRLLGLHTYFTAGEKEVRAWTIPIGAKAPEAAGVIHTDFERGFIRAETVATTTSRESAA